MDFRLEIYFRIMLFLFAFAGFFVARHIYKHKKSGAPLVCPIKFDCNSVVHSDYSKFLGIPLEKLGMAYYAVATLGYFILIFIANLPRFLVGILVLSSLFAFIFSIYLIIIQLFVLKKGCSWCFTSAFICILIFFLNIYLYNLGPIF